MSCNGCRVLRKGCSDSCVLRPCLQWIDGAEAQGHATVFVAKFFGRAGLMGFINAVPDTQRPALFQSLLYEACGRTVNPVFGAVGLLYSGNWHICQAAVEAVLKGGSLQPINHPNPKANAKSGAAKAMASMPVASFNVVNFGHSQARELFMPPQANQTSVKGCAENANLGSTDVQNLVQAQSGVQMTSDPRTALYWQRWSANGASTDNGVKGHHINRKREGAEINNVAKKAHTEDSPNHMLTPDAPKVAEEGDSVYPRTPQVPQLADEQEAVPSKANKVDLDLSLAPHANSQQEQQLQQGEQVQQDQPQQQQQQPQHQQLAHEEQQQDKVARNASSPCRSMCSEGSVTSLDTNATDLTILAGGTNIIC